MAELEQDLEDGGAPVKKRKSLFLVIAGVAIIVVAGLALYALFGHSKKDAEQKPQIVLSKSELYLPLDPTFVVNFQQDETTRYLQVGVSIMSHDQAALDSAKAADPVIRNALVMLFSSQTYDTLNSTAGRVQLEKQSLATIKKIVNDRLGRPGIEAVYFTSFVMQ